MLGNSANRTLINKLYSEIKLMQTKTTYYPSANQVSLPPKTKLFRFFVTTSSAFENRRSLGTDVAGMRKISRATFALIGYFDCLARHHASGEQSRLTTGFGKCGTTAVGNFISCWPAGLRAGCRDAVRLTVNLYLTSVSTQSRTDGRRLSQVNWTRSSLSRLFNLMWLACHLS